MNCFQIEVRGVTFTVWAPNLREAVETFMIDMDFFEVPKDMMECHPIPATNMFPPEVTGFQSFFLDFLLIRGIIWMRERDMLYKVVIYVDYDGVKKVGHIPQKKAK